MSSQYIKICFVFLVGYLQHYMCIRKVERFLHYLETACGSVHTFWQYLDFFMQHFRLMTELREENFFVLQILYSELS